jgi:hypothetical protein
MTEAVAINRPALVRRGLWLNYMLGWWWADPVAGTSDVRISWLPARTGLAMLPYDVEDALFRGNMGRMTRILMLVLGILSVPSVGPTAMQRPHCAQHESSAMHPEAHSGTHQMPASTDSTFWDSATQHECPHCPATECARVAPCTTSSNAAISATPLAVTQSTTRRAVLRRVGHHLYSTTHQPPTPPPQLIS